MNFKVLIAIMAIVVIWGSSSCQSEEFQISEDGYQYKYVTKGSGETPKNGEVVVYNMKYMNEKDSVLYTSTSSQPTMIPCDTNQWNTMGVLYKAFAMIKEGDSILIKIPTKKLFDESFRAQVPPYLNSEGEITFCIGATKYMSQEEAEVEAQKLRERQEEEMLAASAEQVEKDIEIIEAYLKENNIAAQSTESGLRYVIDVEGTGNNPEPGQNVKVHYTGKLLGGEVFDTSFKGDDPQPLDIPIGRGRVIAGWDEGIPLLKEGGKGTLYIPSSLGYGPRGSGSTIPPNSVLVFDVELVDIQ